MAEEWIRAPKYVGRRTDPCLKGNGYRCISYMRNMGSEEKQISDRVIFKAMFTGKKSSDLEKYLLLKYHKGENMGNSKTLIRICPPPPLPNMILTTSGSWTIRCIQFKSNLCVSHNWEFVIMLQV